MCKRLMALSLPSIFLRANTPPRNMGSHGISILVALRGSPAFRMGVKDRCVKDGKLCFKTGKDPYFYWGSHYMGDTFKGEDIGINWRDRIISGLELESFDSLEAVASRVILASFFS